jgi:hypothetical protein
MKPEAIQQEIRKSLEDVKPEKLRKLFDEIMKIRDDGRSAA